GSRTRTTRRPAAWCAEIALANAALHSLAHNGHGSGFVERGHCVMTETGLGFGVLGPLQMHADGAELATGTPKHRAVLAMLGINRNPPVGVDSLLGAAWEDRAPAGARAKLHSYVSDLRKLVGTTGNDPRVVLASAPPGYRLNVDEKACDVGRFVIHKTAGLKATSGGLFREAS